MKTLTATVPAFITSEWHTMKTIDAMNPESAISALNFYFFPNGGQPERWVKVGMAEITVTFADEAEITGSQIAILQAAKRKVQADCEVALNQLEGQIQSLLAIECKP